MSDDDRAEVQSPNLLTTAQAAARCGLSVSTMNRHRMKGTGPTFFKLGHSTIRYHAWAIDAWLEKHLHKSTKEAAQ